MAGLAAMTGMHRSDGLARANLLPTLSTRAVEARQGAATAGRCHARLVSGTPPIRARKLAYYTDRNFIARCLPPPPLVRTERVQRDAWHGRTSTKNPELDQPWSDLVSAEGPSPKATPAQQRAPELPSSHDDLDLICDDHRGGAAHVADKAMPGCVDDDDLAPAL
jgi:hypothetical protein